jgi:two-component system, OmpR family, sensor histidine kinase KdpD
MGLERFSPQEARGMREEETALRRRIGDSLMVRSPVNSAAAWILAVIGPLIVAVGLLPARSSVGLAGFLFGALLAVVVVAVIGGAWPAVASAAVALLLGSYFYAPPYDSLNVDLQPILWRSAGSWSSGLLSGS